MSNVEEILDSLKIEVPDKADSSEARAGGEAISSLVESSTSFGEENDTSLAAIEPTVLESEDRSLRSLSWVIPVNQTGQLHVNNRPIFARGINFTIANVAWRAGGGWPIYRHPSPRRVVAGGGFAAPGLWEHCIAFGVGGRAFQAFDYSGYINTNRTAGIFTGVNDNHYGDNAGSFKLILNGWW